MTAVIWSATDLALLGACAFLGLLSLVFFVSIFVADARDARRRAESKKAFRRARKYFAVTDSSKPSDSNPTGLQSE